MSDYLDALRHELVDASERLTQPSPLPASRRRWWQRSPRALAVTVIAVAASATAIAATAPWQPLFGQPGSPQPRISATAPPDEQVALLGVLRRSQSADDRGETTRQALRYFGTSTQGIYTNYIRKLPGSRGALPAILVPARSWKPFPGWTLKDVLCVFVAEPNGDGGAKGCYTTAQIKSGTAGGGLGSTEYGLVPDGVAQVRFAYPTGTRTVAVQDNFYESRAPQTTRHGPVPQAIWWLDAHGKPTPRQPTFVKREPPPKHPTPPGPG